jgi:hypothetical protein
MERGAALEDSWHFPLFSGRKGREMIGTKTEGGRTAVEMAMVCYISIVWIFVTYVLNVEALYAASNTRQISKSTEEIFL